MISKQYDIEDIIEAIGDKSLLEAIYLIDQEATEVERAIYRYGGAPEAIQYAASLKAAIQYLRYGVKPSELSKRFQQGARPVRRRRQHPDAPRAELPA